MVDARKIERDIVYGLAAWLAARYKARPVALARAAEAAPVPPYPYVAYTVTTALAPRAGTYCMDGGGALYKEAAQVWSMTAASAGADEAGVVGMLLHAWLSAAGGAYLADRGIVVKAVTPVVCRDTLLSIAYEHRCGFDFTLWLIDRPGVAVEDGGGDGVIDEAPVKWTLAE